ncbi:hypothetical protein MKW98_005511, partial [Papaver atlanticum]
FLSQNLWFNLGILGFWILFEKKEEIKIEVAKGEKSLAVFRYHLNHYVHQMKRGTTSVAGAAVVVQKRVNAPFSSWIFNWDT